MRPGMAFGEVLDEVLDGHERHSRGPGPHDRFRTDGSENHLRIATPSYIPLRHSFGEFVAAWRAHAGLEILRRRAGSTHPRPRRKLSMKQKDALDALRTLGARLDADFTLEELRTAFRMLALRYHPDRHITSSDAEQALLAVLFAQARDAYEELTVMAPATFH